MKESIARRLALWTLALLFVHGVASAQVVFFEDFAAGIGAWVAGVERQDHPGDAPNPPAAVAGGAELSSQSSCFSPPFNGVATTLTRTIVLPAYTYSLRNTVWHSTELFGFCVGGTGGASQVLVNGALVTSVGCGVSGMCGVCSIPLGTQSGCFNILADGNVDVKLRTTGGDCARVVGFFDDIEISAVQPDLRTQGFWKRICRGPHPSGEHENLGGYVDCVSDRETFEDVASEDDLCDRLDPFPNNDKCEQAEAQFVALSLNVCSGRVTGCNCVDDPHFGAMTVGDAIDLIDDLLSNPARTTEDCARAQSLADNINTGSILVLCS